MVLKASQRKGEKLFLLIDNIVGLKSRISFVSELPLLLAVLTVSSFVLG